MESLTGLPMDLLLYLQSSFAPVVGVESLSGVKVDGSVTRLTLADNSSVIVKSSSNSREGNFYTLHADTVRATGVGVTKMYWSGLDEVGTQWMVFEFVPHPFPKGRWLADPAQIRTLFYLHSATWKHRRIRLDEEAYRPEWNDDLTTRASEWFLDKDAYGHVLSGLQVIQRQAQFLFEPQCCLSGDPNPTNWRVGKAGEVVLIDWERFCHGHPAIDLAIALPGLGSGDFVMEERVAAIYRSYWQQNLGYIPPELDTLARSIRLAKLWSAVEFLANARLGQQLFPTETITYLVRELPDFITMKGELAL
ncbi:MAG: hypothetical protein A2201_11755 [Alicyclobacillus sp. RIFOXYA1_FULL_53_8]|nr:MAG: hypothetical protein A2201_11755 [Alicyclobacillus sp. RIFOXYA1_FULL_53_8]